MSLSTKCPEANGKYFFEEKKKRFKGISYADCAETFDGKIDNVGKIEIERKLFLTQHVLLCFVVCFLARCSFKI